MKNMGKDTNSKNKIHLDDLIHEGLSVDMAATTIEDLSGDNPPKLVVNFKKAMRAKDMYFDWIYSINKFLEQNAKVIPYTLRSPFYLSEKVPFAMGLNDPMEYMIVLRNELEKKMGYLKVIPSKINLPSASGNFKLLEEGENGYIKFEDEKIFIGKVNARPFQLLNAMTSSSGTRGISSVFEAILQKKDRNDTLLHSPSTADGRKVAIIENAIKELQRDGKISGRIKFKWSNQKKQLSIKTT